MTFDWTYQIIPTHLRIDGLFFGVFLSYLASFRPASLRRVTRRRGPLLALGLMLVSPMLVFEAESSPWVPTVGLDDALAGLRVHPARVRRDPGRRGLAGAGLSDPTAAPDRRHRGLFLHHLPLAHGARARPGAMADRSTDHAGPAGPGPQRDRGGGLRRPGDRGGHWHERPRRAPGPRAAGPPLPLSGRGRARWRPGRPVVPAGRVDRAGRMGRRGREWRREARGHRGRVRIGPRLMARWYPCGVRGGRRGATDRRADRGARRGP